MAKAKKAAKKSPRKAAAKKKSAPKKSARKKSSTKKKSPTKKSARKKTGGKKNKLGVKNSLVNNINARKKKGKSRPKSRSTVSKKAYKRMEENWQ